MTKLTDAFADEDIIYKVTKCGLVHGDPWALLQVFIEPRAIMQRLDDAGKWSDAYERVDLGWLCRISLDGDVRSDGCESTGNVKVDLSRAFGRAAVKFGIGRYLYRLPTLWASFYYVDNPGKANLKRLKIEGEVYYWAPPRMPMEALTEEEKEKRRKLTRSNPNGRVRKSVSTGSGPVAKGRQDGKKVSRGKSKGNDRSGKLPDALQSRKNGSGEKRETVTSIPVSSAPTTRS